MTSPHISNHNPELAANISVLMVDPVLYYYNISASASVSYLLDLRCSAGPTRDAGATYLTLVAIFFNCNCPLQLLSCPYARSRALSPSNFQISAAGGLGLYLARSIACVYSRPLSRRCPNAARAILVRFGMDFLLPRRKSWLPATRCARCPVAIAICSMLKMLIHVRARP